jgi:predicted acetyltransferase
VIRAARPEDKRGIANIWKTCFGDSEEYIDFFFKGAFDRDTCFLYDDNGEAAAMLHLLPITLWTGNEHINGDYLFAAATLPQYRKKGIMSEMLTQAGDDTAARKGKFIALLPANEHLYDYYSLSGFIKAQSVRRASFFREELEKEASAAAPAVMEPDINTMYAERKEYFDPALLWEREMFSYALDEWTFTGGKMTAWNGGYCLYRRSGAEVQIKELCCRNDRFAFAAAAILRDIPAEKYGFVLDSLNYSYGTEVQYGMIKPLGGYKLPDKPVYMNLSFD